MLLFPTLGVTFYLSYLSLYYCIFCLHIIKTHKIIKPIHLLMLSLVPIWLRLLHSLHHSKLILIFLLSRFKLIRKKTSIHNSFNKKIFLPSYLAIVVIKDSWILIWEYFIHFKNSIRKNKNQSKIFSSLTQVYLMDLLRLLRSVLDRQRGQDHFTTKKILENGLSIAEDHFTEHFAS